MKTTRREFLQKSSVTVAAFSTLSLGGCACRQTSWAEKSPICCNAPDLEPESIVIGENGFTIDLAKAVSLKQVGASANFVNPERSLQIIVIHAGKKKFYALSRLCTHGNQVVSYNPVRGIIQCNNYNHSIFDLNGNVVKGPASTPLKSYPVLFHDDLLEIAL